jgi:Ribbon-helix-helix protein, copG family
MKIPSGSCVLTDVTSGNTLAWMPVITLKVSIATAARLQRLASQRRMSKSAVIREALEEKLQTLGTTPSLRDLMGPTIGMVDSGVTDLGHNPKHMRNFGRQ